jgi:hypothetical protein
VREGMRGKNWYLEIIYFLLINICLIIHPLPNRQAEVKQKDDLFDYGFFFFLAVWGFELSLPSARIIGVYHYA